MNVLDVTCILYMLSTIESLISVLLPCNRKVGSENVSVTFSITCDTVILLCSECIFETYSGLFNEWWGHVREGDSEEMTPEWLMCSLKKEKSLYH